MLRVTKATYDLPDEKDIGFRVEDEDGGTVLFFHWHEQPVAEQLMHSEDETATHQRVGYMDVLRALPQRLQEMGLEDEMSSVLGQVVAMFGAG